MLGTSPTAASSSNGPDSSTAHAPIQRYALDTERVATGVRRYLLIISRAHISVRLVTETERPFPGFLCETIEPEEFPAVRVNGVSLSEIVQEKLEELAMDSAARN